MKRICIVGISGKLGQYMTQHALDGGYEVTGVCRPQSVGKLDRFKGRITVYPGRTDDADVAAKAAAGCDAVLTVLAPWGRAQYSSGTAKAVMAGAEPNARLIYSAGWHITRDGKDAYSWKIKAILGIIAPIVKALRLVEIDDQDRACDLIFNSDTRWTVVRGCDLEEGDCEGLPVWAEHVGDPILQSNLVRRTDFALFMVAAATDDSLIGVAPAIVGCNAHSARRCNALAPA